MLSLQINNPTLGIVVPCYNEEEVLLESANYLKNKLVELINSNELNEASFILFVDDGSDDRTWDVICSLANNDTCFKGLRLSRNYGHQNALLAGLNSMIELCDLVISVDADLQDDLNMIKIFIQKYKDGFDIIYGIKNSRKSDSFFKRTSAECYYIILKIMGVKIIYNHADFRALSKRALMALREYKEHELFLRGIIPLIGLKSTSINYDIKERLSGQSKYTFGKMLRLSWIGITSLTVFPLHIITIIGCTIFILSLLSIIYVFFANKLGITVQGWSSLIASIYFFGGLQVFALGLVGEYVSKVFLEVKRRPRYIIYDSRGFDNEAV